MLNASHPLAAKAVLSAALPFRRGGAAADLPQRVKLLGWGENIGRTTGARILVDDAAVASLAANQELVAIERVPMDYEHQSVKGHPNYQADPRFSPGAGTIEVVAGEGVYLSAIDYSANGEQHAESYQDVSAVVHLDKAGRPLWISSVALTQTGDVAGMEFAEAVAVLSARQAALSSQIKPTMNNDTTADETTFRGLLMKFLKLADDATDEDIIAAASKTVESAPKEEADPVKADSTAALSARIVALENRSASRERQDLVARATREGKVIPLSAELMEQTPLAVLSAIVAGLAPGEVPLAIQGRKEVPAAKVAALSADEKGAAARLGLTEEEYLKGKN